MHEMLRREDPNLAVPIILDSVVEGLKTSVNAGQVERLKQEIQQLKVLLLLLLLLPLVASCSCSSSRSEQKYCRKLEKVHDNRLLNTGGIDELDGHIIYLPPDTPRSGMSSVFDTPRSCQTASRSGEAAAGGQRLDFGGEEGEQIYTTWPTTPRSLGHQDFIRYVL
eukprot:768486-Hanusia_phi.AAC.7